MFIRYFLCALLFAFSSFSQPSNAAIGSIDQTPAATLLFPHFEVDTTTGNRVSTVITIQNASATAILGNVTLWTDYGIPTRSFNIYLTGYDTETIDLSDVFLRNFTPVTASAGQDPGNAISPQGPFSQDINFASCSATLPNVQNGTGNGSLIQAHTGQASVDYFNGQCGARNYSDGIARGYVTVDTVNQCTTLNPSESNYFNNVVTTNQNTMLGDYVIVDRSRNRFLAEGAVHIEANNSIGPGQTFYARLVNGDGSDDREALPTMFAGRYAAQRTDVNYWRDPGVPVSPFACGGTPAPFQMGQKHLTAFNSTGGVVSNPTGFQFPYATGTASGSGTLGLSQPLGWLFANLNLSAPNGVLGSIRQSWMTFSQIPSSEPGTSSMGYSVPGVQLGNAATGADIILP